MDNFDIATHNGIITIENTNRGTHRTFQIKTQKDNAKFAPGERILSLLVGPNNTSDYLPIGFVKEGRVVLWRRYRSPQYERLVRVLENPEKFRGLGCIYRYEGRCRRCNRLLTEPESLKSGIGPVCLLASTTRINPGLQSAII